MTWAVPVTNTKTTLAEKTALAVTEYQYICASVAHRNLDRTKQNGAQSTPAHFPTLRHGNTNPEYTNPEQVLTRDCRGCPVSTECCRRVGCCSSPTACRPHEQPSRLQRVSLLHPTLLAHPVRPHYCTACCRPRTTPSASDFEPDSPQSHHPTEHTSDTATVAQATTRRQRHHARETSGKHWQKQQATHTRQHKSAIAILRNSREPLYSTHCARDGADNTRPRRAFYIARSHYRRPNAHLTHKPTSAALPATSSPHTRAQTDTTRQASPSTTARRRHGACHP
jgi:hypothetical protein